MGWIRRSSGAVGALILVTAGPARAGDHHGWQTVADVGLGGLVVSAFGLSAGEHDWAGVEQAALSLGVTEAETYGLKHAFPELRPNGADRRSFPSGHTSMSFAAAGYLQQRYGWRYGLPAAGVATLVGLARVESKDHHWYDVVAGAAVGETTAFVLTKRRDANVQVLPWASGHGAGVSLHARF